MSTNRQTILVIDDTQTIRKLVRMRLKNLDADLVGAVDGRHGLAVARSRCPDLILLDLKLPDMSGFKVFRMLRNNPSTRQIPIIFLADSDNPRDLVKGFELGAVDYLMKSAHPAVLRARVEAALKHQALVTTLERQSRTDALTGLPNRQMLTGRLYQAIQRARTNQNYRFALLFLDLDQFKIINDSLGHDAGDLLLNRIAERIRILVGSDPAFAHRQSCHLPARLGGDEFVILLDGIRDVSEAVAITERLVQVLSPPHEVGAHQINASASIGIVIGADQYERPDDVLRDAETAMYHAKGNGRAQHVVFHEHMHRAAVERLILESELRQAVADKAFSLDYQPIVALESGRLAGFEALMRWSHPQFGTTSRPHYIPLAEELGLIVPLGSWVLREALRQLKDWQTRFPQDPPLTMNVNISKRQLIQSDLVGTVRQALGETRIEPRTLKLEITESVIMEHLEELTPILLELRSSNVQLCLDDFGTGHSSLSCLHRFPTEVLKIDRAFLMNMDKNREYAAVTHAIITLAHNLGMNVVAEGVESAGQLAQLQALNCDYAQGYYFARAMAAPAAESYIRNNLQRAQSA